MHKHFKLLLFIPLFFVITLLTTVFVHKISDPSKNTGPDTHVILNPVIETTTPPKNPTPDSIQVLGVADATNSTSNDLKQTKTKKQENTILEAQTLYNLINSYRTEQGLTKLSINPLLQDSATRKIKDMIANNYFDHADTNNNESWYLFQAAGYQYKFAGENLSVGNNTPWQVFEAWQKSPIHNEQLLKPEYLDMGLSINCTDYIIGRKPSCLAVLHLGAR